MSDDPNAGPVSEQDPVAGTAPPVGASAEPPSTSTLSDAQDNTGVTAPADWPDDWRERLSGGDDSSMALLKRLGSPADLFKKVLAQEQTIRRGAHKATPTLPEGATEEQVAEYRKALGIPESPDGYNVKFAAELNPTEADNALLQDFLRDAHTQHWTPSEVGKAFGWYQQHVARAREREAAETQQARAQTIVDLRREYGAEKDKNLAIADEFLQQRGLAHLLEARLPNGRPVLYDAMTMKQLVAIAREHADEEVLYGGDGGGGASLDDQIAELRQKSALGTITPTEDKRYNELLERRMLRDERRNRGRAA